MAKNNSIPAEDLKAINDSFAQTEGVVITKGIMGEKKGIAKEQINNGSSFKISDFTGRTLKHQKSLVQTDGNQIVIGVRGDKYDNLDIELRKQVVWYESDFE